MAFRVGEVKIAGFGQTDAFRTGQLRDFRRATIAGITALASSCQMLQGAFVKIDSEDRIALAECEIERMLSVKIECSRAVERRAIQSRMIRRRRPFACSGKGRNDSGRRIDRTDAMVLYVADIEPVFLVQYDGMRLTQLRGGCWSVISRKTGRAIACQR